MTKAKEGDVDHKDPHACKDEKEIHDRCFFNWYQEDFLKGKNVPIPCDDVWQKYQNCINLKYGTMGLQEKMERSKNSITISLPENEKPE